MATATESNKPIDNKTLAATVGSTLDDLDDTSPRTQTKRKFVRPPKEGSTHLPKLPSVHLPQPCTASGRLMMYDDVPALRKEMKERIFRIDQKRKYRAEYVRTTQDFWRMELDGLRKIGDGNRRHMMAVIRVYLGQNRGSYKAVSELMHHIE